MIQEVDRALEDWIADETAPPAASALKITFDPPTDALPENGDIHVHLYLYDVRECLEHRDMTLRRVYGQESEKPSAGRKRPPVYFDLSYLLTVRAATQAQEHDALSRILYALLRCSRLTWRSEASEEETISAPLALAGLEDTTGTPLEALWQSLRCRVRPAVRVVVTLPFDPFAPRLSPVVREVDVQLESGPGQNRVSAVGYVVDGTGPDSARLEGVSVHPADPSSATRTDPRGFFYVQNLPSGAQRLVFEKEGYCRREVMIAVPEAGGPGKLDEMRVALFQEESVGISLPIVEKRRTFKNGVLSGLLELYNSPAAHLEVRVGNRRTLTDANGSYALYAMPDGKGVVQVTVPGLGAVDVARPAAK